MVFNIIIIALIGGIAYFHYAQGFFSSTFSAISAVVAGVLAVSYHETLVDAFLKGAVADYATSLSLIGIFALVYIITRTILDKLVPGNLRLPLYVDRVGGAVMGIIAAIFTGGIVALAGQAMPFGPTVAGFARYDLEDRQDLNLPANAASRGRQRSGNIYNQLSADRFEGTAHGLWIPADEIVLNVVQRMSDGGSMDGDDKTSFASFHPNYPDELQAQRLGIQLGASHTAVNLPSKSAQVTIPDPGVFRIDADLSKTQVDGELAQLHQRPVVAPKAPLQLGVRIMFNKDAADADGYVRISPGAVRLVGGGKNFYPIGTLEGSVLYTNKLDDFLLINVKSEDRGADFVFAIDEPDAIVTGAAGTPQKVKDGVFIEVKRLVRISLAEKPIHVGIPAGKGKIVVERKKDLKPAAPAPAPAATEAPAQPADTGKKPPTLNAIKEGVNNRNEAVSH